MWGRWGEFKLSGDLVEKVTPELHGKKEKMMKRFGVRDQIEDPANAWCSKKPVWLLNSQEEEKWKGMSSEIEVGTPFLGHQKLLGYFYEIAPRGSGLEQRLYFAHNLESRNMGKFSSREFLSDPCDTSWGSWNWRTHTSGAFFSQCQVFSAPWPLSTWPLTL